MHTPEEVEESKIQLASDLSKLYKNKEFKKLIIEGYLNTGSIYLVKGFTKARAEDQMGFVEQMKSRSNFWKYLDGIEEDAISIIESRKL